jgi:hypothetical protein
MGRGRGGVTTATRRSSTARPLLSNEQRETVEALRRARSTEINRLRALRQKGYELAPFLESERFLTLKAALKALEQADLRKATEAYEK